MGLFEIVVAVCGVVLIVTAIADLMNTLVSTNTSYWRWWPAFIIARYTFRAARFVAVRTPPESKRREAILSVFGPAMLITLLVTWVTMQIVGFGMIWWSLGSVSGTNNLGDAIYYSAVVFFTVGFGEIVPTGGLARLGAMIEALLGVGTVALVVGYLPTLYGAYSDRERALMTLDAGTPDRITPTDLVIAWAPDADPARLDAKFEEWERWAAGILETHSTIPLLMYFRSHDRKQNWVTALGLLSDAALHAQMIRGSADGPSLFFLRRAEAIFRELTRGQDISVYRQHTMGPDDPIPHLPLLVELYERLEQHGFEMVDYDAAVRYTMQTRPLWAAPMEHLIEHLVAPPGFWPLESRTPSLKAFVAE